MNSIGLLLSIALVGMSPGTLAGEPGPDSVWIFPERKFAASMKSDEVELFDANGDGYLDMVTRGSEISGDGSTLITWHGDENASFTRANSYAFGAEVTSIESGDLNSDGIRDLVLGRRTESGDLISLLGTEDGSFIGASAYTTTPIGRSISPRHLTLADFNGDGGLDVAMITDEDLPEARVRIGGGDGTFGPEIVLPLAFMTNHLTAHDIDLDGFDDLLAARGSEIMILYANGDGTFQPAQIVDMEHDSRHIACADLNGDAIPDLVVSHRWAHIDDDFFGAVSVYFGNGAGGFESKVLYRAGNEPELSVIGDLDGDGRLDIAVMNTAVNSGSAYAKDRDVSILFGLGDGAFAPQQRVGVGCVPISAAIGDIEGDGDLDIVVATSAGETATRCPSCATRAGVCSPSGSISVRAAPSSASSVSVKTSTTTGCPTSR